MRVAYGILVKMMCRILCTFHGDRLYDARLEVKFRTEQEQYSAYSSCGYRRLSLQYSKEKSAHYLEKL